MTLYGRFWVTPEGSSANPTAQEILGTEQNLVKTHIDKQSNADLLLTPEGPLASGEYAIILSSGEPVLAETVIRLWDFKIAQ